MKYKYTVTLIFGVFAFAKAYTVQAQQQIKGIATYMAHTKFDIPEDTTRNKKAQADPMIAKLMEQLKNGSSKEYQLFFTAQESSYDKMVELAKPKPSSGMSISFSASDGLGATIYKDVSKGTYLKQGNIMGKEFVIEDTLPQYAWELQSETKQIGQYTCFKATYKPVPSEEELAAKKEREEKEAANEKSVGLLSSIVEKDNTIIAWYTPDLPISNGPGEFHGLPGLIMEVKTANTILLCTSIEMNPSKGFELKQPKSGKKVSQKEYDTIEKKKMDEMNEKNGGGNGSFRVISIGG